MDKNNTHKAIANFLFEIGTLRKLPRAHQQTLLTQDLSDNIASHSFRVTWIAWLLAKMEHADPYKTVMMALSHDIQEARSGDHNYVHKKYVKVFNDEILKDQLSPLPFSDLIEIHQEYETRTSHEAILAKDADLIDQIILLKEYSQQGNKEADVWLAGKGKSNAENTHCKNLKSASAKALGNAIISGKASEWWENIWTSGNR